jgi:hypothetical protein
MNWQNNRACKVKVIHCLGLGYQRFVEMCITLHSTHYLQSSRIILSFLPKPMFPNAVQYTAKYILPIYTEMSEHRLPPIRLRKQINPLRARALVHRSLVAQSSYKRPRLRCDFRSAAGDDCGFAECRFDGRPDYGFDCRAGSEAGDSCGGLRGEVFFLMGCWGEGL